MDQATWMLLAMRRLGRTTNQDVITWAIGKLEAGYVGRSLRIVAGLPSAFSTEVDRWLRLALQELGWDPPDREAALRWIVGFHALDIVEQPEAPPDVPLGRLREIASLWSRMGYPEEMAELVSLGNAYPVAGVTTAEWRTSVAREAGVLLGRLRASL